MASGAPLLPGASAAQSMYPSTQHKPQNQPPQHDVYAQYNILSNTANVTAAAYAHQMAASAAVEQLRMYLLQVRTVGYQQQASLICTQVSLNIDC